MSRVGILGGTFNPIHKGHIMMAEYCKEELKLDKIILIPTYTPPHKANKDLVDEAHRLEMCRLAVENYSGYSVSEIEIERKGKSYSYITLTDLKNLYPDDEFYFIMGADMFLTLDKWKNPEIIFQKTNIAAIPRDESDYKNLEEYYQNVISKMGAKAVIMKKPVLQVSSTYIRNNITKTEILKPLLDNKVYEYIVKNNLYGSVIGAECQ